MKFPLLAAVAMAPLGSVTSATDGWDWSRTHTWMEFNIRNGVMTSEQAQFAATHYDIIGIGGTFDGGPHSGEVTQAAAAMQLKQYNSAVRTLIYRNSGTSTEHTNNCTRTCRMRPSSAPPRQSGQDQDCTTIHCIVPVS